LNLDGTSHTAKYKDGLDNKLYVPFGFEDLDYKKSDKDFNDVFVVLQTSVAKYDYPDIPTIEDVKQGDTIKPNPTISPNPTVSPKVTASPKQTGSPMVTVSPTVTSTPRRLYGGDTSITGEDNNSGMYDEDENLIPESDVYDTYGEPILDGIYDSNGDPITIKDGVLYDKDDKVIIGELFDKEGNPLDTGIYDKDGNLILGSVVFDEDGNPLLEGIYDINGNLINIRDGIMYDKDGNVITGAIYDKEGNLILGGVYDKDGNLIPGSVVYDKDGNPIQDGIYDINGDPITIKDGVMYDKDGNVITGGIYDKDGNPIEGGIYDKDGNLIPGSLDETDGTDGTDEGDGTGGTDLIDDGDGTGGTGDGNYDEDGNSTVPDLGISLSSDKSRYEDGQIITYTIDFKNRYKREIGGVVIKGEIPPFTKIENAAGGEVKGNIIQWKYSKLSPLTNGKITYQVLVENLDTAEVVSKNSASIISNEEILQNKSDDISILKVLLFSKNAEVKNHSQYIVGYPDKTFGPYRNVTRAEVATVFSRISEVKYSENRENNFSDVHSNYWASSFINIATKKMNLFKGYEDGTFRPDVPITRAELAVVAIKYLKTGNPTPFLINFEDSAEHWAKNFIEEAYRNKLVVGYSDGSFQPSTYISRSEFVTIVNKMLFRGPLITKTSIFPDVSTDYWAFGHINEASQNHSYKRDKDGNEILVK
jgi:hypothetical protein